MSKKRSPQNKDTQYQDLLRIFLYEYKSACLTINGLYPDVLDLVALVPQEQRDDHEADQVLHAINIAIDRVSSMTMLMEILAEQDQLTFAEHFSHKAAIEQAIEDVSLISSTPISYIPGAGTQPWLIFGKESFFTCACATLLRLLADPHRTKRLHIQTVLDGNLLEIHILGLGKVFLPDQTARFREITRAKLVSLPQIAWPYSTSSRDELWFALITKAIQMHHGSVYFNSLAELSMLGQLLALPTDLINQPSSYIRFILPASLTP